MVKKMSRVTVVVFIVEYVDIRTTLDHYGSVAGIHMLPKHGPEQSLVPLLLWRWTLGQVSNYSTGAVIKHGLRAFH